MSRGRRITALGFFAVALSTCGESTTPTETGPAWVSLRLTTDETDAGGVLLTVRGVVDSVRSSYPDVFDKRVGRFTKIAVVGDLVPGVIAEIFVRDAVLASDYTVTVDEAAARTLEQRDAANYMVTVGN